jgi:hypothetical protein
MKKRTIFRKHAIAKTLINQVLIDIEGRYKVIILMRLLVLMKICTKMIGPATKRRAVGTDCAVETPDSKTRIIVLLSYEFI